MATRHATLVVALALTLVSLATWTPVQAQPDTKALGDVQDQIDAHLKAYPGGTQTGPTEISYNGGHFVMTFVRSGASGAATAGAADCPAGWFCFYDSTNFGYPRGKLSDCGWQDLAGWGWQNRTESVHYNAASGSVAFINHAATGQGGHDFDVAVFGTGTSAPVITDTSPHRNTADHVQRYC